MVRPATIRWQDQTPVSATFNDPYYSLTDPVGEVRHTFLEGVNLSELASASKLVIAETGFGTGLNFLLTASTWLQLAESSSCLTFVSVEKYPLSPGDLECSHTKLPDLPLLAEELRSAWPGALPGMHRLIFLGGRIRLLLLIGDAADMLKDQDFVADAWYLDGFAPAKNPDMWSQEVLQQIARLSRQGTRLASFSAAGDVRRGLIEAGFDIDRHPGFGQKRHCIRGQRTSRDQKVNRPPPPWLRLPAPIDVRTRQSTIAVVGAGIAGRCITRALRQHGLDATLLAGLCSGSAAGSALPRALIAPRLVRGTDAYGNFWAQAYTDAIRELDALDDGDLWQGERGLLFRLRGDDQSALQRLDEALNWPDDWMRWLPAAELQDADDALWFARSGAIDPQHLFDRLGVSPDLNADIKTLSRNGYHWDLLDERQNPVLSADIVILACGSGTLALLGRPSGLRNGSGQLLTLTPPKAPRRSILHDGYLSAADAAGRVVAGATINSNAADEPLQASEQATQDILTRLSPYLGGADIEVQGLDVLPWTGRRCDTTDHLPVVGPVQDHEAFDRNYAVLHQGVKPSVLPDPDWLPGLFVLSGLGARGFQAAFLLADQLAALLSGLPRPLGAAVTSELLPSRFQIRDLKRNRSQS